MATSVRFSRKRVEKKQCWEFVRTRERKLVEQARWLQRDALRSRHCFVESTAIWNEDSGQGRGSEKGDRFVGFALAEGESAKRDAKETLFEVREGSWAWKRGVEKGWKQTSAVGDVAGVLCVEGEDALVVAVRALVGESEVIGACSGRDWEGGKRTAGPVAPGARWGRWMTSVPAERERMKGTKRFRQRC